MCNPYREGQATVELPGVGPSLHHLCMSLLGLGAQKMSVEWLFASCGREASVSG